MSPRPILIDQLSDGPPYPIAEGIARAERLVSHRTGIIELVDLRERDNADPRLYWAVARPAETKPVLGRSALNRGNACAHDLDRAIMKAVGETVERYCSASFDDDALVFARHRDLDGDAVDPTRFALFSARQYATPGFPFAPLDRDAPVRWVRGHSLATGRATWLPAALVYVPYERDVRRGEGLHSAQISTGMSCGPCFAQATYKGVMEVIERDAFMIWWQNRVAMPQVDLARLDDAGCRDLLATAAGLGYRARALVLTTDVAVPVFLVVVSSEKDEPPYTMVGLGTDRDPRQALYLALEEAVLGVYGVPRYVEGDPKWRPSPDYLNVDALNKHGHAHAISRELRDVLAGMLAPRSFVELDAQSPAAPSESPLANLRWAIGELGKRGLEAYAVDMTTDDIDEVGFKVVRVLVPGMQPLDYSHAVRHLGGERLYRVPALLGLRDRALAEDELNPYPHPFP